MNTMKYKQFFATGTEFDPFGFQERFRSSNAARLVLKAPTGLGKTDTVLMAWLHRRATDPDLTPKRLVWCLPGRALTEQVARGTEECVARLVSASLIKHIPVYRL